MQVLLLWLALLQSIPVWIQDGNLYAPDLIYEDVASALLSPTGERVAVQQNDGTLVILNLTDDTAPYTIEVGLAGNLRWQDDDILYFNTFTVDETSNLLTPNWDIWRVDAATQSVEQIRLANEGGAVFPADNNRLAWVDPGEYGASDAVVTLENGQTYAYPAVSSGSHLDWIPALAWVGEAVRFPVPDPDLVYAITDLPETQLINLNVDGSADVLTTIQVDYPARVIWSPDGRYAAYTSQGVLTVWDSQTDSTQAVVEATRSTLQLIDWRDALVYYLSDADRLVFWQPDLGLVYETNNVEDLASALPGWLLVRSSANSRELVYLEAGNETIVMSEMQPMRLVQGIE